MKKQRSMTTQLFRVYTLLFLALFLITAAVAMGVMIQSINAGILESQKRIANSISVSVDGYFADMNDFSVSLMNSEEFKQAAIKELPASVYNPTGQTEILQRVYLSAYRMFEKGYRVGVATADGVYIWLADQILVKGLDGPVEAYPDYAGYGRPELYLLPANAYLSHIPGGERSRYVDTPVLSLCRSISLNNRFLHPQAMLEVQVGLSEFEDFVDDLLGKADAEQLQLTVYCRDGSCLYGGAAPLADGWEENAVQYREWTIHDGDLVQWESVFSGNVWLCFRIPQSVYYAKLWSFLSMAVATFLLLLLVMVCCTWGVSRKVTRPLKKLNSQLEQIDLAKPAVLPKVDTQIGELNQIAGTVSELNTKLHHTMQEIVVIQTAEMQSRLMALQSQMQPHFLYNTLAVIGSLSQQGEKERVSRMCGSLSQMLRYVSAEQTSGVLLYEETGFLNNYLMIMQERFPKAQVHVDIPLDMMDIRVPKLILQPLCENSFKYAGRNDVEIWITGSLEGDCWRVCVRDNGPGFSAETIQMVLERSRRLAEEKQLQPVSIDGMGLVNIYARLFLLYGEDFVFDIQGRDGVTIGGKRNAAQYEDPGASGRG